MRRRPLRSRSALQADTCPRLMKLHMATAAASLLETQKAGTDHDRDLIARRTQYCACCGSCQSGLGTSYMQQSVYSAEAPCVWGSDILLDILHTREAVQRGQDEDKEEREESDDEETAEQKLSKRKRKEANRLKIAELKQTCPRPEVVEVWDVTAQDPKLLVYLKVGTPSTCSASPAPLCSMQTLPVMSHVASSRPVYIGRVVPLLSLPHHARCIEVLSGSSVHACSRVARHSHLFLAQGTVWKGDHPCAGQVLMKEIK